jgi:RNA polymerase sigma factor for flagellar operon FliA
VNTSLLERSVACLEIDVARVNLMWALPSNIKLGRLAKILMPLVRRIAKDVKRDLPASVKLEDLIQFGFLGLFEAVHHYHGAVATFPSFAMTHIRNAMHQGLRSGDSVPRSTRRSVRRIRQYVSKLEHELCRPPSSRELDRAMALTLTAYQQIVRAQYVRNPTYHHASSGSISARYSAVEPPDPLEMLLDRFERATQLKAIKYLPVCVQKMLRFHHEDARTLHEISLMLGVPESRVCQMVRKSVVWVRTWVADGRSEKARGRRLKTTQMHAFARIGSSQRPTG